MRRFLIWAIAEEAASQAYAVTGRPMSCSGSCADMEEFDALCDRLFRDRTTVARFTMMVIRTAKEETAIPTPDWVIIG